ncbi:efflux RND transporter periplasmic adaptor subunit [Acidihalobacter ferrooxydans]|uniref:Uncharacterized protein n=1 Tax=Acidihalobacter ferrooxydans TaxID=1765967 RepID=A0A1P8UHM2_9GAMM|nr:efflux RND transporter periplasmic adaptor subunit [Acidihalobacter ferrooxydans]APZ43329.1 hypothetical protein BW247_09655 [Acidihalobacter ferrooxydans]
MDGDTGRWTLRVATAVCAVLLLGACSKSSEQTGRRHGFGGALTVEVVQPKIETVPLTVSASGTLSSPHSVTVTAQITGQLSKVWVQAGQTVAAGQRLFSLEAAPDRAALAQARAKLKGDEAQARYAEGQVAAMKPLVAKLYVTRQTFDQAVATAQADRAQVAQDRAALTTARLNLGYTTLRAPIAGRLGVIDLQAGNAVQANTTALVTLRQMNPLQVNFTLPQSMLSKVLALPKSGVDGSLAVLRENATQVLGHGHLEVVDNGVDSGNGTVTLQGTVGNADGKLWPGQFVTVRLRFGAIDHALVVPAGAVQPGQNGNFVYMVKAGKAVVQPVTVSLTTTDKAVIAKGLSASDSVIYPLPARIRPNATVKVLTPGAKSAVAKPDTQRSSHTSERAQPAGAAHS